ncbi:MAG: PorV/PorQ family protein [Bacteroidota bacterium]
MGLTKLSFAAEPTPFEFLRYVSDARAAALAGCYVSMPEDPDAIFFNPAAVSTVDDKNFSTTFLKHTLDINSGAVTYVRPLEEGTVAGFAGYTNYGSFQGADEFGNLRPEFGANDIALGGTYSNILDTNLYYGVSLKFIFVNIEDASTSALAVDAGIIYLIPDKRTNIGVSVLNAGTQLTKIAGENESLPLDIRAGINHRLRGLPLLVNFTFHHLGDSDGGFFRRFEQFALAGELYFGEALRVRLGYDNQVRRMTAPGEEKGLSGISAGAGLNFEDFIIDYGFARYGSAVNLHRFSLGLNL